MCQLKKSDVTSDGIKVIQSKDGKHELREWTESRRKVRPAGAAAIEVRLRIHEFLRPRLDYRLNPMCYATDETEDRH